MKYQQSDFLEIVNGFTKDTNPMHRYASFDYCYNYFLTNDTRMLLQNKEKSCLVLGFYLASWGMFRGSSFLLNNSIRHFIKPIEFIAELDKKIWKIDTDNYSKENIEIILGIYQNLLERMDAPERTHKTLITKIMLGVFGFIPAYDQFFISSFGDIFKGRCGFRSVNHKSLNCIKDFHDHNSEAINDLSATIFTFDFESGKFTKINYPKAKIIDMYGFTKGKLLGKRNN